MENQNWGWDNQQTHQNQDTYTPEPEHQGIDDILNDQSDQNEENVSDDAQEVDLDTITNNFFSPPSNLKAESIFSEKDIYRILNILVVLEHCDEELDRQLNIILKINGKEIRKAMVISKMDQSDLSDKAESISTLEAIRQASLADNNEDPMDTALRLIARVEDMDGKQRANMIALLKNLAKSSEVESRIRLNKASSSVEIVQEIRDLIKTEELIAEKVFAIGVIITALKEALK